MGTRYCTAFSGFEELATGDLSSVALAVKGAMARDKTAAILTFDDATGRVIDLDLRGSQAEIAARYDADTEASASDDAAPPARGRGRPKLGVVAREVTLLPRHWDWLAAQPGGASVTLRRLVEHARRDGQDRSRPARDAAYRFMSAMGGDLPGFEEASRALFAGDREKLEREAANWPEAIRSYALRLAYGDRERTR